MKIDFPMMLKANRVRRLYTGGKLLDEFKGVSPALDGYKPEEWIGSVTQALNEGNDASSIEGLSMCVLPDGSETLLRDLVDRETVAMLGEDHLCAVGRHPGVLTKLLDSSVRLPIQTHPDRAFASKHLDSPYGKTECWIVLGGRNIEGPPHVYLGFRDGVKKESFIDAYKRQDVSGMLSALNRVDVNPGDVLAIPARVPHAIGSGVFIMEVQEPSDLVFQLDKHGPCWELTPFKIHMGLGDDLMFESFEFDGPKGNDLLQQLHFRQSRNHAAESELIPECIGDFFGATRLEIHDSFSHNIHSMVVGVCLAGQGRAEASGENIEIRRGGSFVIPAATREIFYEAVDGPMTVVEVRPPRRL